jgi:hypothetical protein
LGTISNGKRLKKKRKNGKKMGEKWGKKWGHFLYFYFLMLENLFPFI